MTTAILLDLAVVAVLILFIALGAHKGFVLTLCSLAAVLVAIIGANLVADTVSPMLADALRPKLEESIGAGLDEYIQNTQAFVSAEVLDSLREKGGLYAMAADAMEDAIPELNASALTPTIAQVASAAASQVAAQLARGILFLVAFFLLLIAWGILSHALDLVAKLPVLSQLNHSLGGALGFVKGLLIVYVAVWVLYDLTGYVTPQMLEGSYLFSFLAQHSPMELFRLL